MAETKEQILERLMANVDDKYDKTVGSFMYDTQKPRAIEDEKIYARIEKIADRAFVKTATGDDLKEKLREVGIEMKPATYAKGVVTITGNPNDIVTAGTKVMSDKLFFTITTKGTIGETGTVEVSAICDTPGIIGNVSAGAIKAFPTSVGFTAVINNKPFTGGYDAETEDEAKKRYYALAKKPPTSGNKYHYESWALESSSGVGAAKCIPRWNGPGTVKVLIINIKRGVADDTLIKTVTDYIEDERPVGATVTVESATPLPINVNVTLSLQKGYKASDVKETIESEINSYLQDIAFEKDYVSLAHIGRSILGINGIIDYENLTINNGTVNIDIAEDEVPILGVVTVE